MQSAYELSAAVRAGQASAADAVSEVLAGIEALDRHLHAFLSIDADRARRAAAAVDAKVAAGEPAGALAGVPVALKDNICTAWGVTSCASNMLRDYRSPFSAHVVQRLEAADAVIIGKTNLDEFGMGSSTENSAVQTTRNPWDLQRVSGGSSGGSAAAVASGMVPVALGSDTGGSIRQPASFCSVVGFKPSYGRVSRYGLVAFASSLDQIGPLARDVRDAALLLQVIAGCDACDSTAVDQPVPDYLGLLTGPDAGSLTLAPSGCSPRPVRIGIAAQFFGEGLDARVKSLVQAAVDTLDQHGAEIVELEMPHLEYAIACYYLLCTAEASSNLARFDGLHYGRRAAGVEDIAGLVGRSRAEGFGAEVKRRVMLGTYSLSSGYYDAYYLKASKVRRLIKQDYDRAFQQVDVIASPTSPVLPFAIGERIDQPLSMYLADVYTVSANLAGICAVSLPCGFAQGRLPVGLQLQAPAFEDARLLQIAHAYQLMTQWHCRACPPLTH